MIRLALAAALLFAVDAFQVFRSQADAVHVDVLVTDGNRPVIGLTADDFELTDNGVPQRIVSGSLDDVPLSMLLVLDTSSSVEGSTLNNLKEGAQSALSLIRPRDRAALIAFSNGISIPAPWGSPPEQLSAALAGARAEGTTSLYDATFSALTLHDDAAGYRSLVLVFSDGADTSSWLPATAVLDKARRTDAVVYAIVLRTDGRPEADGKLHYRSGIELSPPQVQSVASGTPFTQELADITGGDVFRTRRAGELRDSFSRILTEFRTRYLLTYTPTGSSAPGWHAIDVKLKAKKGKVRARRGYTR